MTEVQLIMKAVAVAALVAVGLLTHDAEREAFAEAREKDGTGKGIHAMNSGAYSRATFIAATVITCMAIMQ